MLQSIMAAMGASGDPPLNPFRGTANMKQGGGAGGGGGGGGAGGGEGGEGESLFQSKINEQGAGGGGGRAMSRTLTGERAADAADRASKILKTLIRSDEDKIDNAEMAWVKEQVYSDFKGKDQIDSSFEPRSSTPLWMSQSLGHNTSVKADVGVLRPARPSDKMKTRDEEEFILSS